MERYLTGIGETLMHLAVSHAAPAGRRQVAVVWQYIIGRTLYNETYKYLRTHCRIKLHNSIIRYVFVRCKCRTRAYM
jgi:hypothetical protein